MPNRQSGNQGHEASEFVTLVKLMKRTVPLVLPRFGGSNAPTVLGKESPQPVEDSTPAPEVLTAAYSVCCDSRPCAS